MRQVETLVNFLARKTVFLQRIATWAAASVKFRRVVIGTKMRAVVQMQLAFVYKFT
jgi:hypothetical protein